MSNEHVFLSFSWPEVVTWQRGSYRWRTDNFILTRSIISGHGFFVAFTLQQAHFLSVPSLMPLACRRMTFKIRIKHHNDNLISALGKNISKGGLQLMDNMGEPRWKYTICLCLSTFIPVLIVLAGILGFVFGWKGNSLTNNLLNSLSGSTSGSSPVFEASDPYAIYRNITPQNANPWKIQGSGLHLEILDATELEHSVTIQISGQRGVKICNDELVVHKMCNFAINWPPCWPKEVLQPCACMLPALQTSSPCCTC